MSQIQTSTEKYFKIELIGNVAVIRLQQRALEIITELEASDMFISALASLDNNQNVVGLALIKDQTYQENAEVKSYLRQIADDSFAEDDFSQSFTRIVSITETITRAVNNFSKPLVAGINTNVTHEYLAFILPFDFRIASHSTVSVFPNLKLGFPPSGNLVYQLQRFLPPGKVMEMLITDKPIPAHQLVELGLISKLTEDYSLQEDCINKVLELNSLPPYVLTAIRSSLSPIEGDYAKYMERAKEINSNVLSKILGLKATD